VSSSSTRSARFIKKRMLRIRAAHLYFGTKEFLRSTFAPHASGNAEDSVFFGWADGCPFFRFQAHESPQNFLEVEHRAH
jgi:hypothetical protein